MFATCSTLGFYFSDCTFVPIQGSSSLWNFRPQKKIFTKSNIGINKSNILAGQKIIFLRPESWTNWVPDLSRSLEKMEYYEQRFYHFAKGH